MYKNRRCKGKKRWEIKTQEEGKGKKEADNVKEMR